MNNPAYDSGYLNSAKLSGRYLFKLIARNCSDCFGIIYKYMKVVIVDIWIWGIPCIYVRLRNRLWEIWELL